MKTVAYDKGYEAFNAGKNDNPFDRNTEEHKQWELGYDDALEDSEILELMYGNE